MISIIRIAICDDERDAIFLHENMVKNSLKACGIGYQIVTYTCGHNLLCDVIDDSFFYDLILLDIEMPDITGMEISEKIRPYLPNVKIIFITSHMEYAIDTYELSIFRYVPKHNLEKRLTSAITDAAKLIELEAGQEYTIQTSNRSERIPYKDIYYIQRGGKNASIVSSAGVSKVRKSLQRVYGELDTSEFIFIDRSYIVNIIQIMKVGDSMALLKNGEQLPISRSRLQEVKQQINRFWGDAYMMEWYQLISYLLTNGLRLIFGVYLLARLTNFPLDRKVLLLSVFGGCLVTVFQVVSLPAIGILSAELFIIAVIAWYHLRKQLNLCLFLIFFYEVGVGLWDFLISAGLGILFHSERFTNVNTPQYLFSIWVVRLAMTGIIILLARHQNSRPLEAVHFASVIAISGLFGAVTFLGKRYCRWMKIGLVHGLSYP